MQKKSSDDFTKNESKRKTMDILNKLVFHPKFQETVSDLNKINIKLPPPTNKEIDFQSYMFPPNGELVTKLEEIKPYDLDAKRGETFTHNNIPICAYDESIVKYSSLEGDGYLTSHSMVMLSQDEYIPMNLLTLYFYTRAKKIAKEHQSIKYSDFPEVQSNRDFIFDKIEFLLKHTPSNSILFIDGPLIGGDYYTDMIQAIDRFLANKILPIFFVKNSNSNLVTNNIGELRNDFHSDMHWAFNFLKIGQRTNFFRYVDAHNPDNAKIFYYMKCMDISPQRIEFPVKAFTSYRDLIDSILDFIYYLLIVQGNKKNPQVRPIAIAETYARESLRLIDLKKIMRSSGLIPTMNEDRGFAW